MVADIKKPILAVEDNFPEWIQLLRALYPPRGIIHIGPAPVASASVYEDWEVDHIDFVEASESKVLLLRELIAKRSNWTVHHALAAARIQKRKFFHTSLSREDGLLDEEELRLVWRNVGVREIV